MAYIKNFQELIVWQKARLMCNDIYTLMNSGSFRRDFGLREQINRSSGSVMDNIAEGFERDGKREFIQFLSYAKSSASEVKSQLYRAFDRGHISNDQLQLMEERLSEISKMVGGLTSYLKKSDLRGVKFKMASSERPEDERSN